MIDDHTVTDDTRVRVLDVDSPKPKYVCHCRLVDFEETNEMSAEERADLRGALNALGAFIFGGGAAPAYRVEVVRRGGVLMPAIVIAFGRDGFIARQRSSEMEASIDATSAFCASAGTMAISVIGSDGEYRLAASLIARRPEKFEVVPL